MVNEEIYKLLIELAKNKKFITYGKLAEKFNIDLRNVYEREHKFDEILDEINKHEYDNKRPLLTVIITNKDTKMPGKGFFRVAKEYGLKKEGQTDEMFFIEEVNRVFDYWRDKTI